MFWCCCPGRHSTEEDKLSEEEREEILQPRARISSRNDQWWTLRVDSAARSNSCVPRASAAEGPAAPAARQREPAGSIDPRHMTTSQLRRELRERGCEVDQHASRTTLLKLLTDDSYV